MSNLRTRILALLLAVSMLAGYALPAAAEEYQPGTEITGEVEPTPAPEEPATEPPRLRLSLPQRLLPKR